MNATEKQRFRQQFNRNESEGIKIGSFRVLRAAVDAALARRGMTSTNPKAVGKKGKVIER